jgi:hypothetical protein
VNYRILCNKNIFCIIILERIKETIELKPKEEQAGFRPRRSCTDNIFSLWMLIENALEMQAPLIIHSVDFQKTFDMLHGLTQWKIIQHD